MNSAVGAAGGYLAEGARTNLLTYSNDFTNAAWAKVTMTTAMTSTGPDGVANSATRLTASGALSTILQVLAAAASDRTWSVWARRVTGAGTIKLFQGATKTADLSASLNTNTYTQISQDATVDVTLLGVGIEIGTSTDAIDVWCGQFEAGAFASTPIPTTTVAVTRNADNLSYPASGNAITTVGTAYAEIASANAAGQQDILATTGGILMYLNTNAGKLRLYDGAERDLGNFTTSSSSIQKIATKWGGTAANAFISGIIGTDSPATYDGDLNLGTSITIGSDGVSGSELFGTVRNIGIYPIALTTSQLQAMTT